jgi:protein-tyrosine phosphatase
VKGEIMHTSRLQLSGAPNFRDIGGWRADDGRRVRPGRVLRSGHLFDLTAPDLQALETLAIGLVIDLRSELERQRRPSRWPERLDTAWLLLGIDTDLQAGQQDLSRMLREDPTPAGAQRVMVEVYRQLPQGLAARLPALLRAIADCPQPALIHCTAGKDRTGLACACLLHLLGVQREDIYADYLLSANRVDALAPKMLATIEALLGFSPDPAVLAVVNGVDARYLDAAFASMLEQHGSVDAYLAAAGIDQDLQTRLRAQLLAEPACGPAHRP